MRGLLIFGFLLIVAGPSNGSSITDSQIDNNDRKQQKLIHKINLQPDPSAWRRTGRAAGGGTLSLAQILFKLAARRVQSCLVLPQFSSVAADFSQVGADLLAVPANFCFAGAIADIAPQLCSVSSQLLIITAQLLAPLADLISRIANVSEILSNLRLIMVAAVVMTNITPVVMLVISSVVIPSSSTIAVPSLVMAPFALMIVSPELIMPTAIVGVGCRGSDWDN
jgi:hypothetical protein